MECPVIDVSAVARLKRIVPASSASCDVCRQTKHSLPVHLLLIPNQVLNRRNNALLLDSLDAFHRTNSLQNGIRPKAFPTSSSLRLAAHGPNGRSQMNIDAFATKFFAHGYAAGMHQLLIPRRASCDAGWEDGDVIGEAYAQRAVLQTQ